MTRGTAGGMFAFALTFASVVTSAAEPDESKARCKASYETAQVLRREEHFEAARRELAICRDTCPAPLVRECRSWSEDIAALVPTVRLDIHDDAGRPVRDVRVTVDGRAVTERLDQPIAIDPGTHLFRFESSDRPAAETRAEVHAGEREHVVSIVLAAAPPAREARLVPSRLVSSPPPSRTRSYVAFGVGAVAAAVAGILAIKGDIDRASLESSCKPNCSTSDVDAIRTIWWGAVAAGSLSVVAVAVGLVLWPTSPSRAATLTPSFRW
jgi:hypothetical protein